jgi:hypothetical protein
MAARALNRYCPSANQRPREFRPVSSIVYGVRLGLRGLCWLTESGCIAVTCTPESKKPSRNDWAKCLNLLVPERGIEPPTFALRMRCSTV